MPVAKAGPADASPQDPLTLLRSRSYLGLLVMAALVGVPVSAAAFGFLALVGELQPWIYTDLPEALGFDGTPRVVAAAAARRRGTAHGACRAVPAGTRRP